MRYIMIGILILISTLSLSAQQNEITYTVTHIEGSVTYGKDSISLKKYDDIKANATLHFSDSLAFVSLWDGGSEHFSVFPIKSDTRASKWNFSIVADKEYIGSRGAADEIVLLFIRKDSLVNIEKMKVSGKTEPKNGRYFIRVQFFDAKRDIPLTVSHNNFLQLDQTLFKEGFSKIDFATPIRLGYYNVAEKERIFFKDIYIKLFHMKVIQQELMFLMQSHENKQHQQKKIMASLEAFLHETYGPTLQLSDFSLK